MSPKGEVVRVFVRDLLCIETIDGLVESGGDGKHDSGVSIDALELNSSVVGAMAGDWSGE